MTEIRIRSELARFFVYSLGSVSTALINFILLPLYLNRFTASDYGILSVSLTLVTFGLMFVSAGTMSAMQKQYFEVPPERRPIVVGNVLVWYLFGTALLGIPLLFLASEISTHFFGSREYAPSIAMLGPIILLTLFLDVPLNLHRLSGGAAAFATLSVVRILVEGASKYTLIAILDRGIQGYFEASIIALAISAIGAFATVLPRISLRTDLRLFRDLLRISTPYIVAGFSMWSLLSIDRLMLNFLASESAAGVYSLGASFGQVYNMIFYAPLSSLLPAVIFPLLKDRSTAEMSRIFSKMMTALVAAGSLAASLVVFGAVGVIELIDALSEIDPRFLDARAVIPWMTASQLFYSLGIPAGYIALHFRKTERIAAAGAICAAANIVLNALLISRYGAVGAAVATCISYGLYLVGAYISVSRLCPTDFRWRAIAGHLAVFAVVILSGLAIRTESIVLPTVMKGLGATTILFVSAAWIFRLLDERILRSSRDALRRMFRRVP